MMMRLFLLQSRGCRRSPATFRTTPSPKDKRVGTLELNFDEIEIQTLARLPDFIAQLYSIVLVFSNETRQ